MNTRKTRPKSRPPAARDHRFRPASRRPVDLDWLGVPPPCDEQEEAVPETGDFWIEPEDREI